MLSCLLRPLPLETDAYQVPRGPTRRGLEECNARGFLNFPSEAPHHLNELAKLGRLFLSDVSPAGAPA